MYQEIVNTEPIVVIENGQIVNENMKKGVGILEYDDDEEKKKAD